MKFLVFAKLRVGGTWPDDALTLFQQTIGWINDRLTDGTLTVPTISRLEAVLVCTRQCRFP